MVEFYYFLCTQNCVNHSWDNDNGKQLGHKYLEYNSWISKLCSTIYKKLHFPHFTEARVMYSTIYLRDQTQQQAHCSFWKMQLQRTPWCLGWRNLLHVISLLSCQHYSVLAGMSAAVMVLLMWITQNIFKAPHTYITYTVETPQRFLLLGHIHVTHNRKHASAFITYKCASKTSNNMKFVNATISRKHSKHENA